MGQRRDARRGWEAGPKVVTSVALARDVKRLLDALVLLRRQSRSALVGEALVRFLAEVERELAAEKNDRRGPRGGG